ncbi:sterol desaturase family protein [Parvularcula sp. ZS-1/3]|uniref:Sterol desaturase family protein n=1 Tax=Parvularcula mediterranea TaxID=2732508 RepID=A0A7Y3RL41_9PROT|nr:sterol desaturase family protein [Parvularcula mediterranea]NNU15506.1 sterol desaturase family protein [Parvularcula mediterranea]
MVLLAYIATIVLFTALFTREVIAPASGASCDKRWRILAGAVNAGNVAVVVITGFVFSRWIGMNALLPLPFSDPFSQSVAVFLTASFLAYWWHRLIHKSDTLWRMMHQLHHSPPRIEVLTAFYVHPLDSLAANLLNAGVAYLLFGVSPWAAGLAIFYVSVFNLIAHADQKTPHWLGFLTQRPEMHRLHHERGVHARNYGLPIWDAVFGTYANPRKGEVACGFEPENALRIKDMLLMRKVQD